MSPLIDRGWAPRAANLADRLEAEGALREPAWKAAVAAIPRHRMVPTVYRQDLPTCEWRPVDGTTPEGLDLVYSPTTLVTKIGDNGAALSSGTDPAIIVRMLELLDIRDGDRVLAVGTGSGYTTALLCHRLGAERVVSIDIDDELVAAARRRLAGLDLHPTLAAVDGAQGLPDHAPYDRILATCSVPSVPWAWAEQLAPGGVILVNVMAGAVNAGNLALLRRNGDRLEGRFTSFWASFIGMRQHGTAPAAPRQRSTDRPNTRATTTPPTPWWDNTVVWLLAQFHGMPAGVMVGMEPDPDTGQPAAGTLTAPDGSWATISLSSPDGERWEITDAGPTPLWPAVERAHRVYQHAGQPSWDRLGVTTTPHGAWIWLDDPQGQLTWRLR